MIEPTCLKSEQLIQQQWRLRTTFSHLQWFDHLVAAEFLPPVQHQQRWFDQCKALLTYVNAQVPYYQRIFQEIGFSVEAFQTLTDWQRLPILTKQDLLDQTNSLQALQLPPKEHIYGVFTSSGTTGRPTKVPMTATSNLMFSILLQRQYRMLRFNPRATLARILWANDLAPLPNGQNNPDGATISRTAWRYVGRFFETGPELDFNRSNSFEAQVNWLSTYRPQHLVAYSGVLEALAYQQQITSHPPIHLDSVLAVSEQMTPFMRQRIETTFCTQVHQNYGLNEIGLVAVRCPHGRYHIHTEHCWAEIVDKNDQPCAPGEIGRLIVTGFKNAAMPLLRYDTGDLALAVDGPCACGRTLPAFGPVMGRYRRYAYLPERSMDYFRSLLGAFANMPLDLTHPLRQVQLHQYRNQHFELRYQTTGPLPSGFFDQIQQVWQLVNPANPIPLSFREVPELEQHGRKLEAFTSDFAPQEDTPSEIC